MVGPIQSVSGAALGRFQTPAARSQTNQPADSVRGVIDRRVEQIQQELQGSSNRGIVDSAQVNRGVNFNPRPDLNIIQARVVDRQEGTVLRSVPSDARLDFATKFRQNAADFLGQVIDRLA